MIMVEEIVSLLVQLFINNEMDKRKKIPQINANLDKNKSQRISEDSDKAQ